MPAKVKKKTVLGPLCCVVIFVVWIDATTDKPSSQHALCLRECSRLARGEGLQRKSQVSFPQNVLTENFMYVCHLAGKMGFQGQELTSVRTTKSFRR